MGIYKYRFSWEEIFMADRIFGYCPDCGRPLRRLSSHGSAAVQLQFPELAANKGNDRLFMENYKSRKNSKQLEGLAAEASKQLIIDKIKKKLSLTFDKNLDCIADEIIGQIVEGKKIEDSDFWNNNVSGNEEILKALNDLLAA
jgi:hypothetical protein